MAFLYTPQDIRKELMSHAKHGAMYKFVLQEFDKRGFGLTVQNLGLFGGKYKVSTRGITIDTGADDIQEAAHWTANALREWAKMGIKNPQLYFAEIARAWATDQKGSVTKCLGSTVDFLYLFSYESAERFERTFEMYRVDDTYERDLKGIFLWVYVDWWTPYFKESDSVQVKCTQSDLHADYLDSLNASADQTHHYAFYFYVGVRYGKSEIVLDEFLAKTHDIDDKGKKILNAGDYYLGYTAAHHGDYLDKNPGFIGDNITSELQSPSPEKAKKTHASLEKRAADPWINDENEVAHPASPSGKGGLGRFASAKALAFEGDVLPHPNSPAARTLSPLEIYRYEQG